MVITLETTDIAYKPASYKRISDGKWTPSGKIRFTSTTGSTEIERSYTAISKDSKRDADSFFVEFTEKNHKGKKKYRG